MATDTQLYFLDFGFTNMRDGVLQGRIMTCNADGKNLRSVLNGVRDLPDGIGIDKNHIFYTGMGNPKQNNGTIYRVDLDGKDHKVIVPSGSTHTPKQLQVVPAQEMIYWCDREGMKVMRCRYDGTGLETLVQTGSSEKDKEDQCNWCVGIAVDRHRGKMYWTQKGPSKGDQGRLFSANLEMKSGETASHRSDVKCLLVKLPEPIDLELDEEQNILYMTDRGEIPFGNSISRIQLSDEGVVERKILIRKLHEAIGLTLDKPNGKLYYTDLGGSVYSSDLDGGNAVELLHEVGDVTGIAFAKA